MTKVSQLSSSTSTMTKRDSLVKMSFTIWTACKHETLSLELQRHQVAIVDGQVSAVTHSEDVSVGQ